MREAFTLIELLVVLVIVTLVMGVVVPKGVKMLSSYGHSLDTMEEKHELSKARANSFLQLREYNVTVDKKLYTTTIKGVILESSNDND